MQSLDIAKIIDDGPFGRARLVTVILCFLAVLVDGFDTQAIGYIAPALVADWHVAKSALAPVFASSLAGLMVGAFMFGSISDRKGRKFGLTLSVALFGVFSLMTAMTHSITALLVMRFLTGIGLGGVMPNAVSLTSEYAPSRVRSTVVMVMFCGFSLGAALGGVVSNSLLAHYSWRAVLIVGGLAPLLLAPVLLLALRESIDFMVEKQFPRARIKAALASIAPHALIPENALFERKTSMHARASIGQLFTEGRAALTLLLWIIFFMSLLELYFISNWLPLLLHQTGLDVGHAVMTSSLFQIGGTIGTLMLGRFIDRCKPFFVLGVVYMAWPQRRGEYSGTVDRHPVRGLLRRGRADRGQRSRGTLLSDRDTCDRCRIRVRHWTNRFSRRALPWRRTDCAEMGPSSYLYARRRPGAHRQLRSNGYSFAEQGRLHEVGRPGQRKA
jgi:AAHS family 4-hydroxybenzoate transporter-like MFS transporter